MQKINFKNLPDTSTPLNATNLNLMQDNIESAIEDVEDTIPTIENSLDGDSTTDAPSVHAVKEGLNKNSDSYLGFESSAQVITSNDVLIKNMELTLNTTKPNILIIFSIPVKTSGDGSPFIRVYLDGTQKAGYTTNQSGLVIMSYATILTDVPAGQHTISIKASRSNTTSITIAEYISKSMSVIEL